MSVTDELLDRQRRRLGSGRRPHQPGRHPVTVPFAPADPSRLLLTPEQRADDASPDPVLEALAVHLYETDTDSEFNQGDDVEWRYNFAHRDRYRDLARAALEFVHVTAR